MKKTVLGMVVIVIALTASLVSCQKDWPELTPTDDPIVIDGGIWNKDGYGLVSTAEIKRDTVFLYKNIPDTFAIKDSKGEIVEGDFIFGDGAEISGNTVTYAYASTGTYVLKIIFKTADGTMAIMSGPVEVLSVGVVIPEVTPDEGIISLYHAVVNGKCQDTIGLAVACIEKASDPGTWFVTGDFSAWLAPASATTLTKVRTINGKQYLIWGITHAIGLERFGYGKYLNGLSSWGYAPRSIYWHSNTNGGGEFWLYFTAIGISYRQ